jgi:uncharacterized protein YjbJ (UPF0337 family)
MDRNILKAKWKQLRGKSKIMRARLTNNDRGRLSGKFDVLVGGVQEKYSVTRQKAARGFSKRVSHYQTRIKKLRPGSKSR